MKRETLKEEFGYHIQKAPYFEGWYIKCVQDEISLAIIIGISSHKEEKIAFIQTNSTFAGSSYTQFKEEEIWIEKDPFCVKLKNNVFCKEHLLLNLKNGLHCDLYFDGFVELDHNAYMPTIMGPFSYLSHMECVHSIVSLYHHVHGRILYQNEVYRIKEGIGYMEKDRGCSFPSSYTWYQSNHCQKGQACFFFSNAMIPMGILHFQGVIGVLIIEGKQLRFATYLGCRVSGRKGVLIVKQYPYKIYIKFLAGHGKRLKAPKLGNMHTEIMESLDAEAILHIYRHGKKIQQLHFVKGGFEVYQGKE